MDTDLDTFLTAVYTQIDTLLDTVLLLPPRPGPAPKMADSEVLTLLVVGQWHGSSERALLRWAVADLHEAFPTLITQSAFNRRARRLGAVCARLMILLAEELGGDAAPYEVVDTITVPLARQCRGKQHRLFADEAGIGRGGSDHRFLYGCSLLLAVTPAGVITGFVVGSAATQDRWLLDAFLLWRRDPAASPWTVQDLADHSPRTRARSLRRTGPTGPRWWPGSVGIQHSPYYLTDQGFRGPVWHAHWVEAAGAEVIATCDVGDDRKTHRHRRQIVETVNGVLSETLHLAFPRAKCMWGVVCRIARKGLALNLGIWCNRLFHRPDLALETLMVS
jgi:hypothetical protein